MSYQVKHRGGKWLVVQTQVAGGTVVYATDDASKLFDYVRRGPLGYFHPGGRQPPRRRHPGSVHRDARACTARVRGRCVMTTAIHPFERAGLGKAPFRCTGWYESKYQACHGAPVQPGSSCDYCSQGIMLVYVIKSADGKTFKVGCDCVAKVARDCAKTDFEREAQRMIDAVNKIKTAASNARKDERIAAARAKLEANRDRLAERTIATGSRVHPARTYERNALEYFDWMFMLIRLTPNEPVASI